MSYHEVLDVTDSASLRFLLESVGLDVMSVEYRPQRRQFALVPGRFYLARDADSEMYVALPSNERHKHVPRWTTDGEPSVLIWSGPEERPLDQNQALDCLWDFIELNAGIEDLLPDFVGKWGLLDWHALDSPYPEEWEELDKWESAADMALAILQAMVACEDAEVLPVEFFGDYRLAEGPSYIEDVLAGHMGYLEATERRREDRAQWLINQFDAGRGLEIQRHWVASALLDFAAPRAPYNADEAPGTPIAPVWDERGRRVETRARGVREVVAGQLLTIFGSPELGIVVCSMCGRPYPLDEGLRRPKRGVRRLCSDECKREAKRESNRASWHKNKDRWSRPAGERSNTDGEA